MGPRTSRRASGRPPLQTSRPLLPPAVRPLAIGLLAVCVVVAVLLGTLFAHHTRASWLDARVDPRLKASLGGHRAILKFLVDVADPIPVAVMTTALFLGCLATRRWRAAVFVAVPVPVAGALTEYLLKPLIDRTLVGGLSFPSGHTTGIIALAGTVAVLLINPIRPRLPVAVRVLLALAALLTAAVVAVALVTLGLHYFTDTVGGAAVGTSVVLATALIIDRLGSRGDATPGSTSGKIPTVSSRS
jgi:membrane-associated phospholipid phosphatase